MKPTEDIVLPRRAHKQPRPTLNPGGDCASCAIGGVMQLSVDEVHNLIETLENCSRSRHGWPILCREFERRGILHEFVADIPIWFPLWVEAMPHGLISGSMRNEWWRYVRMAIRAGYYGLASITYNGDGYTDTDHMVVICGVRERWEAHAVVNNAYSQILEVLVSCSASCPEGEWRDIDVFLRTGGYDVIFVLPK